MSDEATAVAVIGAGPAGLSFAAAFARLGRRSVVLERGPTAGDSWRRMPRDMKLNSAWGASSLRGSFDAPWGYARRVSRAAYHGHLVEFARERALDVRTGMAVGRVQREGEGFRLDTAAGPLRARAVVNATGYFGSPWVPDYPGLAGCRIPQITIPEYGSVEAMAERIGAGPRTVLIVGKRITAGQLALELHDAGHRVLIANRSEIRFAIPIELQQWGFPFYYPYEALRLRFGRYGQRSSSLLMAGGRTARLIQSGEIRATGPIRCFAGDKVEFEAGRFEAPDGVLWATGYRPTLGHLEGLVRLDPETGLPALRGFESREAPGLFFLGLDQQRDFTSRMMRGIRRDAGELARTLASELPPAAGEGSSA